MNIAYVRVSTVDQNEDRQIKTLESYNIDKWYIEKVSAKDTKRPKLQEMLDFAREGDTIYIDDFSRLARSTSDLLKIVEKLQSKKIELMSHKEKIDTSTATGKLMLTMISAINEFERLNMLERQREGIALAKCEGKYKGRKPINRPKEWEEVYLKLKQNKIKSKEAMEYLNIKRTTFYKMLKEYEQELEGKVN